MNIDEIYENWKVKIIQVLDIIVKTKNIIKPFNPYISKNVLTLVNKKKKILV